MGADACMCNYICAGREKGGAMNMYTIKSVRLSESNCEYLGVSTAH